MTSSKSSYLFAAVVLLVFSVSPSLSHSFCYRPDIRGPHEIVNCGDEPGRGVGWEQLGDITGPRCGVCGDNIWNGTSLFYNDSLPHEYKNLYWPEEVGMKYLEGQVIQVDLSMTNAHGGGAEWRICSDTIYESYNQSCFNEHVLEIISVTDSRFSLGSLTPDNVTRHLYVNSNDINIYFSVYLRLPANLTCSRCVLQYTYMGWADQMFRTCSDIEIVSAGQLLQNVQTGKCLTINPIVTWTLTLAPCNVSDVRQSFLSLRSLNALVNDTILFGSNGNCLDVCGKATSSGTAVINYKCSSAKNPVPNQSWTTIHVNETTMKFKSQNSGMCVDTNGTNIYQSNCDTNETSQQWTIVNILSLPPNISQESSSPKAESSTPQSEDSTPQPESSLPESESSSPGLESSSPASGSSSPESDSITPQTDSKASESSTTGAEMGES